MKEASHRLRIAQGSNADLQRQKTKNSRQSRWLDAAKTISAVASMNNGMYFTEIL